MLIAYERNQQARQARRTIARALSHEERNKEKLLWLLTRRGCVYASRMFRRELIRTYPLRQKSIAWPISPAVAQDHPGGRRSWPILDHFIPAIMSDEPFEPCHQLRIAADEIRHSADQDALVDKVLREEVAKLEKLVHGLLVGNEFLHPVEEGNLLCGSTGSYSRRKRLRKSRSQSGRHRDRLRLDGFRMTELGALIFRAN